MARKPPVAGNSNLAMRFNMPAKPFKYCIGILTFCKKPLNGLELAMFGLAPDTITPDDSESLALRERKSSNCSVMA